MQRAEVTATGAGYLSRAPFAGRCSPSRPTGSEPSANLAPGGGVLDTAEFASSRLAALQEHFLPHPSLDNVDYREIFEVSRYAAARELRWLVKGGFLRTQGKGRGAHYLPQLPLDATRKRAK